MGHFDKLQASINSVKKYQSLAQQSSRYLDAGWPSLELARSLWDLWSDDAFTPPDLRKQVDAVEPFDEWEEFALYGGHYFLLVASNAKPTETSITKSTVKSTKTCSDTDTESHSVSLQAWPQSTGDSWTQRRLTAAITLDDNTLAFIGGQGPQNRLPNMDILSRDEQRFTMKQCTPLPPARVCHTTTSLGSGNAILVGGRASPTQALADCWLIKDGEWSRTSDLGLARYRHCTAAVNVASQGPEEMGVLVFGGKASDGTVLDDWLVWTANSGWRSVSVDGPRPPARFGAAMAAGGTAQNRGLLIGGIGAGGTVLEDSWEWSFSAAPEPRVNFQNLTNDAPCGVSSPTYARIGANLVPWGDSLLLVGGVSKKGIHSWAEDFVLLAQNGTEISTEHLPVRMPSKRPLLVGMGVAAISRDEIVIAGGGAVCFAMGSFWNEAVLSVTRKMTEETRPWRPLSVQADDKAQSKPTDDPRKEKRKSQQNKTKKSTSPRTKNVPRVQLHSKDGFSALCAAAKPAIIEGSDLGPCSDLWTAEYLQAKLDTSLEITVQEFSPSSKVPKDKDSESVKRTIASFFDNISSGFHACLPAVSSSQSENPSSKLEEDFSEIAGDFQLPPCFEEAKSNHSNSSLQISGPTSLPLHYNVLSNIVCQVRGRKTLHVYPPSDVKYLAFPPGSSCSDIDVLTSRDPDLRLTHPHIAHLGPGDVLFIPPMWSYTETTDEGISMAVNVLWRSLKLGHAEERNIYGKQDLQAYEDGRQDVEKIVKAFEGMPEDVKRFYLDRLAGEILEKRGKFGAGKKVR
jgi:tRNA wybutosine-synthesizing protein 4